MRAGRIRPVCGACERAAQEPACRIYTGKSDGPALTLKDTDRIGVVNRALDGDNEALVACLQASAEVKAALRNRLDVVW